MTLRTNVSALEEKINAAIRGFTDLVSLSLIYDESVGYDMQFVMRNSANKSIRISCRDVAGLNIQKFGGGLTQVESLRAYDVRDRQLDRIKISFFDRASETTFFDCADVEIQEMA